MMRIDAVLTLVPGIARADVTDWIARGWVTPGGAPPDWVFTPLDASRVRLVRDLRIEIGIEEDTLPLVLSLLDQVYELRGALRDMVRALDGQPDAVRAAVLRGVRNAQ